jgi:hypothetical protein
MFIETEDAISVTISDANDTTTIQAAPGITIDQVLREQKVNLNPLDRVDPPLTTTVVGGELILITRVTEEFSVSESVVAFEQQTVKNESLAEGQTLLIQPGVNGLKQSTHRILRENGVETSRTLVKEEIIQPAKPEIVMIGVQSPFSALDINGVIAYISSANAWIMNSNTGNRRVVASTGDLDGRVFSLSYDRKWLLFSRSADATEGDHINSLWLVDITRTGSTPFDTGIRDVVLYAEWVPGRTNTFAYSTVEPREAAPGWQANNDLHLFTITDTGAKERDFLQVEINSGGIYGWWGTTFKWSPDGSRLAYSRPDSIGLVNFVSGQLVSLLDFEPYQPKTDWAWVPGIEWSRDGSAIYTVQRSANSTSNEDSEYDLVALLVESGRVLPLVDGCGLFCYPVLSTKDASGYIRVGYLSAIFPTQSETSRYNLYVMDRDASNRKKLYPSEGQQGLDPQLIAWSPGSRSTSFLAFIAQGNLMLSELPSGVVKQVTGDGSIARVIWR